MFPFIFIFYFFSHGSLSCFSQGYGGWFHQRLNVDGRGRVGIEIFLLFLQMTLLFCGADGRHKTKFHLL